MVVAISASGSKPSLTHPGIAEPRGSSFLRYASPTIVAILVDAAFFLKRAVHIYGRMEPDQSARRLHSMALSHLNDSQSGERIARLYRILVYDAPPSTWKGHTPIAKRALDYSRTATAEWRLAFHSALRRQRKVALRLGEIPANHARWQLKSGALKRITRDAGHAGQLTDDDFRLDLRQKGVDMRLGIDVASLAYKQQVNTIVLVSGDADFVPAAKLARREGIDFVLDPMWATIRPDLSEHVDGIRSVCPKPGNSGRTEGSPDR